MKYIKLFLINILVVGIVQYFCFWIADITDDAIYEGNAYLIALVTPFVLFIVNFLMEKRERNTVHSSLLFVLVGSIVGMFFYFALNDTPFQNDFPYDPLADNESTGLLLFLYKAVFFQCLIGSILYEWVLRKRKSSVQE